jgi:endoglycosylceramidase
LLLSEENVAQLSDLGFNAVRLGLLWAGVEPNVDAFNATYLQELDNLVQRLAKSGIYTILDLHQDVMSPKFCGEGFPDWAVMPSNDVQPFAEPWWEKMEIDSQTG